MLLGLTSLSVQAEKQLNLLAPFWLPVFPIEAAGAQTEGVFLSEPAEGKGAITVSVGFLHRSSIKVFKSN